jgi:hypothetical protein
MKIPYKLLGLAGLVAAAVVVHRKRRLRAGQPSAPATEPIEPAGMAPDIVIVEAEIIGLADVDPEALTQMGEAIDPDLTEAAHEEIPEQRGKLPVSGKNVP